jgi:hypothetical protein
MKTTLAILLFPFLATALQAQTPPQRPWQEVTVPTVGQAAANFKSPPREYGAILPFASWNGADPAVVRANIVRDFDRLSANGLFIVNLSPGRRAPGEPAYLSPGHMDQVKFTVAEAAKRNMRLWFQDESDYPSGFAGGYISERYPQLGMQALLADIMVRVYPGETLDMPVPASTMAIWATETEESGAIKQVVPVPLPSNGELKWITPAEGTTPNEPRYNWQVTILRHTYLSSNTRNFNRADGSRAKDGLYSLIDYLDPKATDAFLHITHDTYYEAVGDQFGKTILGFFGDEPEYQYTPWSPTLQEQFMAQKGYDVTPYMSQWFNHQPTEQSERAAADYTDVWSGIFRSSFFGEQANWAKAHNVEYLVHLNHEETMQSLERSEGDFFRDERYVEVPGIDNLNQLIPSAVHTPDGTWNINNNFPKLASSTAHLFGKPKVWAEEGGGTGIDGKYQMDFQLVRGVTTLALRVPWTHAAAGEPLPANPVVQPQAKIIAMYGNRGGYLMSIGRPAAQVGLYHPGNTIWMGGDAATEADHSTTKLGWQLFEHQIDWDYFDEQSLSSVATLANGGFTNLSGQTYKAIVLPSMTVITRTGLARLKEFAQQGGKVIFVGKTPTLILDKTFMDAKEKPDLSFATLIEPSGDITAAVLAALPKPDVKLDAAFQRLTYTHRQFTDGDMYFFFNESNKAESRVATLAGHGTAQDWDLATGEIHPLSAAKAAGDTVTVPLSLGPYEAKVIVVGPLAKGVAAAPEPSFVSGTTLMALDGDWKLDLNGKQMTTALKPWEELGTARFAGPATYTMQFTAAKAPKGKRVFLEIADVHDYAKVTLNGKEVGAKAWQPYRWDVTDALKKGSNDLKIEVNALGAEQRPGAPPAAVPAAGAGAAPAGAGVAGAAGAAGARRRPAGAAGAGAPGAAGAPAAGAPPAGVGGAGRATTPPPPPTSGLLGSVKLVAY